MKTILKILLLTSTILIAPTGNAEQQAAAAPSEEQLLLRRIYELRMRFERERSQAENQARANVRLVTQTPGSRTDSPTVTGLRSQTNAQLARFEQQFRCLDVDVESNSGNTVDFKVMIHKIHRGAELNELPYQIWGFRNSAYAAEIHEGDYVVFIQAFRNDPGAKQKFPRCHPSRSLRFHRHWAGC